MLRPRVSTGLIGILLVATAAVMGSKPASGQEPTPKSDIPRIADDYDFQAGDKFYPEAAQVKHPRGYCVVHAKVDPTGTVRDSRITHSTGSAILDKTCLAAVTAARFTAEMQNGMPVEGSTDIAIYW